MDGTTYFDFMKIALMCILWYASSTSDNILGKIVLSDFPYPMTVTMAHLMTAALLLGPVNRILKVPRGQSIPRRYYCTMIIPLALGKFISSVSSYISLWRVSVSYAHTVKATLPLFTVLLSRIILGEKQTWPVYLTLVPIITGVCIATATELSFDRVGLASSVFATFCFSLQTIFTKKCLKDTAYHHLELLTFITRISTMLFFPFWLSVDLSRIMQDKEFLEGGKVTQTTVMLTCAGMFNTLHNILAFTVLAMVTPLSYAVANATKRIAIIGGSLLILQNPVSSMNILGMMVAVVGVLSYNKAKYDQHQAARRKEVLPYVRSSTSLQGSHLGVPHLPHSRSDANFLKQNLLNGEVNGAPSSLVDGMRISNGHILLQDWQGADNFTLIPLSEKHHADNHGRFPVGSSGAAHRPSLTSTVTSSTLHSRSSNVFHV